VRIRFALTEKYLEMDIHKLEFLKMHNKHYELEKTHNKTSKKKKTNMKNILFSLLILPSSLIYSTNFKVNVKKKQELQPLYEQEIYSSSLEEEDVDFDIQALEEENAYLNHIIANGRHSSNGWKVLKGIAGLCLGTKLFSFGSTGVAFSLLSPDHIWSDLISQSSTTLSPIEKILTNRSFWLSLCGACTALSVVILKKSADNLYQGLYKTEDTLEYF